MDDEAHEDQCRRVFDAAVARMQKAAKAGVGVRLSAEEVWLVAGFGPLSEDIAISQN